MLFLFVFGFFLSFSFCASTADLIPYPFNNEYPHVPDTIRVEGIVDLSGPFFTENTQNAVGWMMWRDWVNEKLGGLCLPTQFNSHQSAIDFLQLEQNHCAPSERYNVSMVLWDVMEGGSLTERLPLYTSYYKSVCNRTQDQIPHIILSPYTSTPASAAVQGLASYGNYGCNTFLATLASTPSLFSRGYKFLFTSFPSPNAVIQPLAQLIGQKSKKVAVLSKFGDLLADSLSNGLINTLKNQYPNEMQWLGFKCSGSATSVDGQNCLSHEDCPAGQSCTFPQYQSSSVDACSVYSFKLTQWVKFLKDQNPDIFVISGHSSDVVNLMESLRIVNWTPKMALTSYPISMSSAVAQAPSVFWIGSTLLDSRMNFSSSAPELYMGSTSSYCQQQLAKAASKYFAEKLFKAGTNRIDDCFTPGSATTMLLTMQRVFRQAAALHGWSPRQNISRHTFDVLYYHLYHLGYKKSNTSELCQSSSDPNCVLFQTFWGSHILSTTGSVGLNTLKTSQPFQIVQNENTSNKSLSFFTSSDGVIFPARWDWTIYYNWFSISFSVLSGLYSFVALTLAVVLISLILVWVYRNHGMIKGATVPFLVVMHIAAIMVVISSLTFTWEATPTNCLIRRWFLPFFTSLWFLPLVTKTQRIVSIFKSQTLHIRAVTLSDLFCRLMVGMVIVVLLLCLCEFVLIQPQVLTLFNEQDKTKVDVCSLHVDFTMIVMSCFFVVGIVTLYLANKASDLDDKFNEFIHIRNVLGVLLLYSIFALFLTFTFDSFVLGQVLTKVITINMGVAISILFFMYPKFWKIYKEKNETSPYTLGDESHRSKTNKQTNCVVAPEQHHLSVPTTASLSPVKKKTLPISVSETPSPV
jgi:hypothetical protein